MRVINRIVLGVALGALAGQPLSAQRGGRGGQPPVPPDTANPLRKTQPGGAYALDFQQQDLRVVLSAVAEAGNLNVTLNRIPSTRIDLRMGVPQSREGMLEALRGLAASHNLTMTETPSLIRIEGPVVATQQSIQQQQVAAQQLRLYTYRLKHASAVQLAPVLMQLFSGVVSNAGRGVQGVQFINPGAGGAA